MGTGDSASIFFGWGKRGRMAGKPGGKCGMYALLVVAGAVGALAPVGVLVAQAVT